jgi:hypothetical protein
MLGSDRRFRGRDGMGWVERRMGTESAGSCEDCAVDCTVCLMGWMGLLHGESA